MNRAVSKAKHLPARLLLGLLRRLKKIGIVIDLFITVRESEQQVEQTKAQHNFRLDFLSEDDFDELLRLDMNNDRQELTTWFQKGILCFGVWDQTRLVAKMWCDPNEFDFPPNYRKLEADEVYLFAAYSDPDYRGQGLAPLMRSAGYAALREKGKNRFYSYTDYFNAAARRFKEKLGARNELLRLHFGLFGKWSKTVTLRRYS